MIGKILKSKIIFAALLILTLLLAAGCQKKMTVQDYLYLGEKYLTEANYEEAIVAFSKAIELEPKVLKAYEGLADAYIKTGDYEKAEEIIQKGIVVYESLTEAEQTEMYQQIYEALLQLQGDAAIQSGADTDKVHSESEMENSGDSEELEKLESEESEVPVNQEQAQLIEEVKEKYGDILKQVIAVIDSGEPDFTSYLTVDFDNFAQNLESPLIWRLEDGRYLGIYNCGYIYLGEMKDGIRSGIGSWYRDSTDYRYVATLFKGHWAEDYPNGMGVYSSAYILNETGSFKGRWTIEGDFVDGYENGTMRRSEGTQVNDEEMDTEIVEYSVTRGVPDNLYQKDGGQVYDVDIVQPDEHDGTNHVMKKEVGYYGDIAEHGIDYACKE